MSNIPIGYSPSDTERFYDDSVDISRHSRRSPFEVDKGRIIHSPSFRRLQGKTQVFTAVYEEDYRTRLTHTLEVAQLGRGMCCELEGPIKPDPDLVEAICLGHDIGHPPFGHIGERTLNNLLRDIGGYDANLQNIRILCVLEEKHPRGGLNLTRATLDGLLKFWTGQTASYDSERPIVQWVKGGHERTSLEAQICDWADTAAYSVADIEDSMRKARLSRRDVLLKRDDVYKEAIGLGVPQDICTHCIEEAIRALPDKFDSKSRQFYVELKEWTSNVLHIELLNPCTILERCRDESCLRYRYALQIPERSKYFALCLRAISKTLVFRSREVEDEDEIHRNCIKELFEHYDHILSGIIVDRNKRLRIVADTISSFTDVGALKKCKEISGRDM